MKIHVVKKGETVGGIARKYALEEKQLRLANALAMTCPLCPGQSLFIPGDFPKAGRSIELCIFCATPPELQWAKAFTYLCPYSHSFDSLGALFSPGFDCSTAELRKEGCAPLLCLSNSGDSGGFSPELAHLLFTKNELKERLFEELIEKLKANSYFGLQICFNYLFPFDRDNYSAFVLELSQLLHCEGFMLSVELSPPDIAPLSAAFDYAELGKCADRLSLMFCRWGHSFSPPQPPAPTAYIRRALDFVAGLIPPEKLLLGISGCGFDWTLPWHSGDRAQQISNLLATERAMAMGLEIRYDARAGTAYYDYTDPAAKRHRVYFEDARSISEKSALVEEYSLAGISLYSWETCLRGGYSVMQRLYNAEKLL